MVQVWSLTWWPGNFHMPPVQKKKEKKGKIKGVPIVAHGEPSSSLGMWSVTWPLPVASEPSQLCLFAWSLLLHQSHCWPQSESLTVHPQHHECPQSLCWVGPALPSQETLKQGTDSHSPRAGSHIEQRVQGRGRQWANVLNMQKANLINKKKANIPLEK